MMGQLEAVGGPDDHFEAHFLQYSWLDDWIREFAFGLVDGFCLFLGCNELLFHFLPVR